MSTAEEVLAAAAAKEEAERLALEEEEEERRKEAERLRQMAEAAAREREAEAAAEAERIRVQTENNLKVRPKNLEVAKQARLDGRMRPCIGVAAQVIQKDDADGNPDDDISGCRLVPFDVSAMAAYLGAPMAQWPGLCGLCRLALTHRLPKCWEEMDPIADKLYENDCVPEWSKEKYEELGGSKLVYCNQNWPDEIWRTRAQHPRDAFYRQVILYLLNQNECPFKKEIMQFNTTATDDVEQTSFWNFQTMRANSMTEALDLADASKIRRRGWKLCATTLVDDDETRALLTSITPAVEAQAARTIWGAYNFWRRREVWVFLSRIYPIRRNVLVRRLQLAVRRRAIRLKLVAWEGRVLRKQYMRQWWKTVLSRDSFLFSLRRATAKRLVDEAAEDAGVYSTGLGTTALPKDVEAHFVTMRSTLAMMEQWASNNAQQLQPQQPPPPLSQGEVNEESSPDVTTAAVAVVNRP